MLPLNETNLVDLYPGGERGVVIFILLNHKIKKVPNNFSLAKVTFTRFFWYAKPDKQIESFLFLNFVKYDVKLSKIEFLVWFYVFTYLSTITFS